MLSGASSAVAAAALSHSSPGILLVSEHVISVRRPGVSISSDGNSLKDAVSVRGDDVVQLVTHAARAGHVRNAVITLLSYFQRAIERTRNSGDIQYFPSDRVQIQHFLISSAQKNFKSPTLLLKL